MVGGNHSASAIRIPQSDRERPAQTLKRRDIPRAKARATSSAGAVSDADVQRAAQLDALKSSPSSTQRTGPLAATVAGSARAIRNASGGVISATAGASAARRSASSPRPPGSKLTAINGASLPPAQRRTAA